MPEQPVIGTAEEQKTFIEVHRHYQLAKQDLEQRIIDFDRKDILFRSHIVEQNWPYNAMVFDPRVFTALFGISKFSYATDKYTTKYFFSISLKNAIDFTAKK